MFPPELEHKQVAEDSSLQSRRLRHLPITPSKARPKHSWLTVLLWLAVGIQFLVLGLEVLSPVLSDGASVASLKEALWRIAIILGVIALGVFYDSTPVAHLSAGHRALTNFLLCIGGVAFMASLVLIRFEHHVITFVSIVVCVLSLFWAKSNVS